jgi:methylated-DNA-[protein]-cysteine S-methyltransferase
MGRAKSEIGVQACQTARGWVAVAWTARGLAGVALPAATEAEARRQVPQPSASVPEPPPGLDVAALLAKLQRYFDGNLVIFDEPLDPTIGTAWQRQVWAACRAIPRGQTRGYGELARQVGSPGAARAVGQAMARNPWPIVVPCHRVLGSQRQLTGFGGGLDMKRAMLIMEGGLLA